MEPLGTVGDDEDLSARMRAYANQVVRGSRWSLTSRHVDLSTVTFETSRRMQRRHGVCRASNSGCTIRLSQKTADRAGMEAIEETVRHELVHVYQHQQPDLDMGHGPSFERWVEPLELSGRCATHYETNPEEYKYRLFCSESCGFVGGRYRFSTVIERAVQGQQICSRCGATLRVETAAGVLDSLPETGD